MLTALLLAAIGTHAEAQEVGRVTGRVVDAASKAPIGQVQVYLQGTAIGTLSRQDGQFMLLNVPVGTHTLRAERIGMGTVTQEITVAVGEVLRVDLELSAQALGLDEIVVTGTAGASRRREIGNTIAQINAADLPSPPTQTAEILQAAAPGIQVTRGDGGLGQGYNIRLRGNTSISMSNQPIIYIDGVRMQSKPFPIGNSGPARQANGGAANIEASPLNNINPNDIDRIEVIKGSAATTLYGTEASAGVIQIFTKRGAQGAPVWNLEVQQGWSRSLKFGTDVFPYHRLDPYLNTGYVGNYAASVRGGGQALQYFASGQFEGGTGIMPQDTLTKWVTRGNFAFTPIPDLQIQWNNSYATQSQRNTAVGSNVYGLTLNAYRGHANYFNSDDPGIVAQLFDQELTQKIERFTSGGTVTYSPLAQLTNRLTIGYDFANQEVRNLLPFGFVFFEQGQIWNDTWQNRILTMDYVGTFSFNLMDGIRSSFSWGGQTVGEEERQLNGYGEGFPGAVHPTVNSAATRIAEERRSKIWNAGFFLQNVFDIRDKYFLTIGARVDGNSAFGSGFGLQFYPKASGSWVISDEGFWREGWGSLKLRAAYGQSGRAPGAFDAVRTWNSVGWGVAPALVPGNLGSPNLGPEVTAEFEAGFDAAWLEGRLSSTLTYYSQTTTDALFNVSQIPTNGFLSAQRENVGKLNNKGLELALDGSPIRGADWGWDLGLNISTNHSKVVDLGGIPPFSTSGAWVIEGHPVPVLRGAWVRNGDKVGTPVNCTADIDPSLPCIDREHIFGPTQPTLTWSPNTTIRMPMGISVSARGEYRGGHYMNESITSGGISRSAWMPLCWPYYVNPYDGPSNNFQGPRPEHTLDLKPDTPALWRATCTPSLTQGSFTTRKADFFRLRSVSAQIPVDFLFPDQVSTALMTLSLNNAWSWYNKEWGLLDPDTGSADGLIQTPGLRAPPIWSFNAALRLQL